VAKLKTLKNMPEEDVEILYKAFVDNIVTDDQIIEVSQTNFIVGQFGIYLNNVNVCCH